MVINNEIQDEIFIKEAIEKAKTDNELCIKVVLEKLLNTEMPNAKTALDRIP